MFKVKELTITLPSAIIISSKDNNKVNALESGKYGRQIFTKSVSEIPLGTEDEIKSKIKNNIDNKVFGANSKLTIKNKGFDKYGVDSEETYNNLKVKKEYKTIKID
jgi:hypothetical protein